MITRQKIADKGNSMKIINQITFMTRLRYFNAICGS